MTRRPRDAQHTRVTVTPDAENPDMVVIRTRKRRRKRRRHRKAKIAIIVIAIIVVIAVVAALSVRALVHKGEAEMHVAPEPSAQEVTYNGSTYRYNNGVVTFLILGEDDETTYDVARPEASCTDVNMLLSYDTVNNTITVVSIPRDAMVEVDLYRDNEYVETATRQLAVAYSVDVDTEEQCAENASKSVSTLFYGLPVGNYFVIDETGFKEMTHAVGGVTVTALDTYPGAAFAKGDTVLLEGESAWSYVRYRDVKVAQSATSRLERQTQFVKAFLDEVRNSSPNELVSLYRAVSGNSHTNLNLSEIVYLASRFASNGGPSSIDFVTLAGETRVEPDVDSVDREHVYLDGDSVRQAALAAYYEKVD